MREQVQWFAEQMESKLKENDHKGGWLECDYEYLIARLREESLELRVSLESAITDEDILEVIRESVDVANFAMMIADKARRSID
ncbi:hypothetical protein ACFVS2_06520 [Brevibacillus sp. NPDC058079]|uniref:hypothetical protein n=1 Tax=Brevibacillus sp. NPDC058079 TaxID=3346330 RepID=UPI0036ECE66A